MVVAAGHTAGTCAEVERAVAAGLTGFTHLFNAMSQLGNREPGAVGVALISDGIWCSLIVDALHVSTVLLKLARRCKPLDRFLLVSDAMPPPRRHAGQLHPERTPHPRGERAPGRRGRTLAGADLDMLTAVRNAHEGLALPAGAAFTTATANPADFLSLDHRVGALGLPARDHARLAHCGMLAPGYRATFPGQASRRGTASSGVRIETTRAEWLGVFFHVPARRRS